MYLSSFFQLLLWLIKCVVHFWIKTSCAANLLNPTIQVYSLLITLLFFINIILILFPYYRSKVQL